MVAVVRASERDKLWPTFVQSAQPHGQGDGLGPCSHPCDTVIYSHFAKRLCTLSNDCVPVAREQWGRGIMKDVCCSYRAEARRRAGVEAWRRAYAEVRRREGYRAELRGSCNKLTRNQAPMRLRPSSVAQHCAQMMSCAQRGSSRDPYPRR